MRPIVAVGILLIGLHGGAPERDQEPRRVAGEHSFAFLRNAPWMGKAEREAVLAVPPAVVRPSPPAGRGSDGAGAIASRRKRPS